MFTCAGTLHMSRIILGLQHATLSFNAFNITFYSNAVTCFEEILIVLSHHSCPGRERHVEQEAQYLTACTLYIKHTDM